MILLFQDSRKNHVYLWKHENQFDRNIDALTNRIYKAYSQISCTRVSVVAKFRNSDSNRKLNVIASWYIYMCNVCHTCENLQRIFESLPYFRDRNSTSQR